MWHDDAHWVIINRNERSPLPLGAYVYTKLQTWWYIQCCKWITKFALSDILHSHCGTIVNISFVVVLGFWFFHFNRGSLDWGCVCRRRISSLFVCLNLIYVLKVTVIDVCGLNYHGCCLCLFKNCRLGVLLFVSVSLFLSLILACQHGVLSALNIWDLIVMLFLQG